MVISEFVLSSPAFKPNTEIPSQYTCEGKDISPPLKWNGAPKGTKSFAIVVDDPDAPDPAAPKMTWVHWVIYNIPANVTSLAANAHDLPQEIHEGHNDWKVSGYRGPCPPVGRHHYHHKIYALDTLLPERGITTKVDLEKAMHGHILSQAELVATYEKKH
ncbi:YbhB/YbcL family Raf kinase inhibitor-like protein [Bdellovibrio sp. HCB337]|uniref:YbhB/YbcL family Raf kinase inhibitor-like protein n=1 Tax=Bdellovibrio sp. HCB337 TaxID=3394358 RepID=UPI0039A42503